MSVIRRDFIRVLWGILSGYNLISANSYSNQKSSSGKDGDGQALVDEEYVVGGSEEKAINAVDDSEENSNSSDEAEENSAASQPIYIYIYMIHYYLIRTFKWLPTLHPDIIRPSCCIRSRLRRRSAYVVKVKSVSNLIIECRATRFTFIIPRSDQHLWIPPVDYQCMY